MNDVIQEGTYKLKGKILLLPVYGEGQSKLTLSKYLCTDST